MLLSYIVFWAEIEQHPIWSLVLKGTLFKMFIKLYELPNALYEKFAW